MKKTKSVKVSLLKGGILDTYLIANNEVTLNDSVSAGEESNIYKLADATAYSNLEQKFIALFYLNKSNPSVSH